MKNYRNDRSGGMTGSRVEWYWKDKYANEGNVRYRNSKSTRTNDVNYDYRDILTKFGITKTEFGNWMSVSEREDRLEALRDGLVELSRVVGFENLGLYGELAVCFGGRGRGGRVAGHFEPWDNVINLTKTHKGVFVHEWTHAVDYIVGGGLMQDKRGVPLSAGGDGGLRVIVEEILRTRKKYKLPIRDYFLRPTEILARTIEDWYAHKVRCRETDIMCKDMGFYERYSVVYMTDEARKEIFPLVDLFVTSLRVGLGYGSVKDAETVNTALEQLRAKRKPAAKPAKTSVAKTAKNPAKRKPAAKPAKTSVAKRKSATKPAKTSVAKKAKNPAKRKAAAKPAKTSVAKRKAAKRKPGSQLEFKFK